MLTREGGTNRGREERERQTGRKHQKQETKVKDRLELWRNTEAEKKTGVKADRQAEDRREFMRLNKFSQ